MTSLLMSGSVFIDYSQLQSDGIDKQSQTLRHENYERSTQLPVPLTAL